MTAAEIQPVAISDLAARRARAVRALLAALMATTIAVALHGYTGGAGSFLAVAVTLSLTTWVAMMLAGKRFGYLSLTVILSLAQVLVHLTMTLFSNPLVIRSAHSGALLYHGHGMDHHAAMGADHALTPAMVAGHAIAAALSVILLKRGEDTLFALLNHTLGRVMALIVMTCQIPTRPQMRTFISAVLLPITAAVREGRFRRGPPVLA